MILENLKSFTEVEKSLNAEDKNYFNFKNFIERKVELILNKDPKSIDLMKSNDWNTFYFQGINTNITIKLEDIVLNKSFWDYLLKKKYLKTKHYYFEDHTNDDYPDSYFDTDSEYWMMKMITLLKSPKYIILNLMVYLKY